MGSNMHKVVYSKKFLKDFKKYSKSGILFKEKLYIVIKILEEKSPLPEKYNDYGLHGKWGGYRECHILFDLLLVYKQYDDYVELITLGTHSELF
jgi:mRNA interferase YafQ